MRWTLILALVFATGADAQQRVFENERGQTTGRAVTDSYGRTNFYDSMGRTTGRSVTDSRGNTQVFDNMGRRTGSIRSTR